jgi:hypothetical protein
MAFYIVETDEQLKEFSNIKYNKVFVELILHNDHTHPALNELSLLYIKPLNGDKGYILCLDHTETLLLNKTPITQILADYDEIYVRDRKTFIYFFPLNNLVDISFTTPDYVEPSTSAHDFFYQRQGDLTNINTIIPVVKHYEKCELIYDKVKNYCVKSDNNKFLNKLTTAFFSIERNGLKIDKYEFDKHFEPNNEAFFIQNNTVYSKYNLYTTTRRPSNSFNGINFAALGKDNGSRKSFIPKNDCFIEIDISSYHPTLAAQLVNYDFGSVTPYEYFAKEAGIDISEAKTLMFRQLYGGVYKEYQYIEYFQLIQEHVNKLWSDFTTNGYVECPISGHKFTTDLKDINPQKLFNYTLQNLETSTNIHIIWDVIKILKGKKTQIVLYTYDSILLDYSEEENILEDIKQTFEKHKLKVKLTTGKNYGVMK